MHDWLPIGHMQGHITRDSKCPRCQCSDETIKHMLKCPNSKMREATKKVVGRVVEKFKEMKIPENVKQCLIDIVKSQLAKGHKINVPVSFSLKKAYNQQRQIGFDMMMRGFLSKEWKEILRKNGTRHPEYQMSKILKSV